MIPISELKQKVKSLVEDITGLKACFDLVPNNVKTGVLITRQATEFTGRTVDGEAHIAHHGFEVFIFSFLNADSCDAPTDKLVNATDGKYSDDFRLIMVNSITPTEYDPDVGFWGNVISMEFVER
mgnify:CR=1 FL=1